ncbi:hypothetical protein GCM10028805_22570 [Spirosoma harenae]
MASDLSATVFNSAVLKAKDRLMAFEKRRPDLGVLEAFDKYKNGIINPTEHARLRASARRPIETVVRKKSTPTVLSTRTISATPNGSQTAKVTLSYNTYGGAVGVTEAINADNYLDATDDLAGQIEDLIRAICLQLETDGTSFLEAAKYTSLPTSSLFGAPVSNAYETTTKDVFMQLPAALRKLGMTGPFHMISNVEALATITEKQTFGAYNQQNLEKLLAGYEFAFSPSISANSGSFSKNYVIPTNSLSMVQWTEFDCRKGIGSYDAGKKYYTMPFTFTSLSGYTFTIEFGVVYVGATVDKSAVIPGLERSWTEAWYPFVDIAFAKAYSSDTSSPIVKVNVSAV